MSYVGVGHRKSGALRMILKRAAAKSTVLAIATLVITGCGGGSSGTVTAKVALTIGGIKKCLQVGGAERVAGELTSNRFPESGEGGKGTVTARGPGGGGIEIGLFASPKEARKTVQIFAAGNREISFENVGSTVIALSHPAATDRELAARCVNAP